MKSATIVALAVYLLLALLTWNRDVRMFTVMVTNAYIDPQSEFSNETMYATTANVLNAAIHQDSLYLCVAGDLTRESNQNSRYVPVVERYDVRQARIKKSDDRFTTRVPLSLFSDLDPNDHQYRYFGVIWKKISSNDIVEGCTGIDAFEKAVRVVSDRDTYVAAIEQSSDDFIYVQSDGLYYVDMDPDIVEIASRTEPYILVGLAIEGKGQDEQADINFGRKLLPLAAIADFVTGPIQIAYILVLGSLAH